MKSGSIASLLHILLLAELMVQSWSRPVVGGAPSCSTFSSMKHQVDRLRGAVTNLHDRIDDTVREHLHSESRLESLPHIPHSAAYFDTITMNASLLEMYLHTQTIRLHVDWLKTTKENISLATGSAGGTIFHLGRLSDLIRATLQQMNVEAPEPPAPTLPVVTTAYDTLHYSVEIAERLRHFCLWSKRVLVVLDARCPRQQSRLHHTLAPPPSDNSPASPRQ